MGNDIISELPDSLITQILLWIPTKDSVKTSVLSTRWRNLWLNVPGLEVHASDFCSITKDVIDNFTERFMEFNVGSRLQKFKISNDLYDDIEYSNWIATMVDRGIQHVHVEDRIPLIFIDTMPRKIYQSKTLVSLKLVNVGLENPEIVSLPCLKILYLKNVWCNGPLIAKKLISGCPVLEDLTMDRIYHKNLETPPLLRLKSQTLKIFRLTFDDWGINYSVEIDAPGLKYMRLRDGQSKRIVVKNLSSLFTIDLDTKFIVNIRSSLLKAYDLRKRAIILGFLTNFSNVRHMIISQPTVEVLYHCFKLGPIPNFHNLYHLKAAFSSSSIQLLPALLESCPNLKILILDYSASPKPEKFDLTKVPRSLISTLEFVKINKLIMKEKSGIKLVNYFLENSAVLKKLTLSLTYFSTMNQVPESYKKLLTSTKLSPTCQVIID